MHVLTEQEIDERWRKTLAAGVLRPGPYFFQVVLWFVNDLIGVFIFLESARRYPNVRTELLIFLLFFAILWVGTGYRMLKLCRDASAELEKKDNPALVHASYIGFQLYQSYRVMFLLAALMVEVLVRILRK